MVILTDSRQPARVDVQSIMMLSDPGSEFPFVTDRTVCELEVTSLVVLWLRIHLPIQGTWVLSLVQEDPTCPGATKPKRPNTEALAPYSLCSATGEVTARRSSATRVAPTCHNQGKTTCSNEHPAQPKNEMDIFKKRKGM